MSKAIEEFERRYGGSLVERPFVEGFFAGFIACDSRNSDGVIGAEVLTGGATPRFSRPGILRVTSPAITEDECGKHCRDFDAEKWNAFWVKKNDVDFLRLEGGDIDCISMQWVEFSSPASVEFIPEE